MVGAGGTVPPVRSAGPGMHDGRPCGGRGAEIPLGVASTPACGVGAGSAPGIGMMVGVSPGAHP